jgi:hypothetical protein
MLGAANIESNTENVNMVAAMPKTLQTSQTFGGKNARGDALEGNDATVSGYPKAQMGRRR